MKKSIFFIVKYMRSVNKQTKKSEILEIVYLVDRIKNRDMLEATIILDLINQKVEKTRNPDFNEYEKVLGHYRKKYPEKLNPIIEEYEEILKGLLTYYGKS